MKIAMKRGMAVMLCLAMVAGLFIGLPNVVTAAGETTTPTGTPLDVTNADFESVIANPYWTVSDAAQVTIESGVGRNGTGALHIKDITKPNGDNRGFNATSEMFDVQPGTSITASVYTKGITSFMLFVWIKADGTPVNSAQTVIPEAADWTLATCTQVVPEDAKYAKVMVGTGLVAAGDVYFDDLSVKGTKVNTANTNLLSYTDSLNFNTITEANTTGVSTTYDEATDTATINLVNMGTGNWSKGGYNKLNNNGSYSFPANATYVVEFDLNVTSYTSESTALVWLRLVDYTNDKTAYMEPYVKVGNSGANYYEFTTSAASEQLRFYVRPRVNGQTAEFSISGLTVYAKTGELLGGDFEPSAGISGWTPSNNSNVVVKTGNGVGHAGNSALCITDARDDAGYNAESAQFPAVSGQAYTASAYFKGDCDGQLYLAFYDENGERIANNGVMPAASSEWTSVTNTYTAPEGAVTGAVILATSKAATGTVYFDDVAVQLNCMHPNEADFTVVEPATCYKAGKKTGTCSICNQTGLEFEVPMLDHEWVDGTVITPASCANPGVIRYVCKHKNDGCTAYHDEDIPLDEHTPVLVAAKPATADADGCKEHYECKCGAWFKDAEAYFEITDKGSYIIAKTGVTEDTEEDKTPEGDASKDEPHPTGDTAVLLLMGVLMVVSCGFVVAAKVKFGYRR